MPPGRDELAKYTSDHGALVSVEKDRPPSLVESTLPLRARDEHGTKRPVSLALERRSTGFVADNPLVGVTISDSARGGVTLSGTGVGISPAAAEDVPGVAEDGAVMYSGTHRDVDFLARPVATGAEVLFQLRSIESPERQGLDVRVPMGARIVQDDRHPDGLAVVSRGTRIATIAPPAAFGADGASIPVEYDLEDSGADGRATVTLVVPHRSADAEYPILVDPVVSDGRVEDTYINADWDRWEYRAVPAPGSAAVPPFGGSKAPYGMWNAEPPGANHYLDGDHGEWYWRAPGTTRIDGGDFYGVDAQPDGSCNVLGIYGWHWEGAANWECNRTLSFHSYRHCVDQRDPVTGLCRPVSGNDGNDAVFAIFMAGTGWHNGHASSLLRHAVIVSHDWTHPPAPRATAPPTAWVDSATLSTSATGTDGGFGVKRLSLTKPLSTGGEHAQEKAHPCGGDHASPCPASWRGTPNNEWTTPFSFTTADMAEGRRTVKVAAQDVAGNRTTQAPGGSRDATFQVRVDHSAPQQKLSGSLYDRRGQILPPGVYTLSIAATDGSTSSADAERSGVKSIEVFVNGDEDEIWEQGCDTSCSLNRTWELDTREWPATPQVIRVVSRDQLGHETSEQFTVTPTGTTGIPGATFEDFDEAEVTDPAGTGGAGLPPEEFSPELRARKELRRLTLLTSLPGAPMPGEDTTNQAPAEEDVFYDDDAATGGLTASQANTRPIVGLNREGINNNPDFDNAPTAPPDTTGAVSRDHYVEVTNSRISVYRRRDLARLATMSLSDFGRREGDRIFDPQIQWDHHAQRWLFVAAYSREGRYRLEYGWSRTADPTDLAGGWCRRFTGSSVLFDDYPKLGHNRNHMIIGTNVFRDETQPDGTIARVRQGSRVWVIAKPPRRETRCLRPVARRVFPETGYLQTADGHQAFTPVPANTLRGYRTGFVVAADSFRTSGQTAPNQLMFWHVVGSASAPSLVAEDNVTVTPFDVPPDIPQPFPTADPQYVLDALDTRLTQAVVERDPNDGTATVWTQHTILGPGGRAAVRWYELVPPRSATDPRVPRQEGLIASGAHHVFNGAISPAANGNDAAVFYNVGSNTLQPRIRTRVRRGGDPPGIMGEEVTLRESNHSYQDTSCRRPGLPCRWGDYAGASPDPRNSALIWGSNQYVLPLWGNAPWTLPDGTTGPWAHWGTRNFAVRAR